MECPRCHARTIVMQKSRRVCKVPECFFEDQHPISYDNDVRHYQGQKNGQNRFSTLYNASLDHGGVSVDRQANYDKQLKRGLKNIRDVCLLLKLSQKIESTAEARFITILRLQIRGKLQKQQRTEKQRKQKKDDKQEGDNENKQEKIKTFPVKQLACYSVYSACFQNQNFFQDNNLARWLKFPKKKWDNLLKELNSELKNKIDFIPTQKPWHYVVRVCRRRKIDPTQQRAMIRMCQKISERGIQDGCPRKTVAACVFWKVCEHSQKYKDQIKLHDICKKHEDMKDVSVAEQQKYFDTTPDTIKKFFTDKMEKEFYQVYLPEWDGRDYSVRNGGGGYGK